MKHQLQYQMHTIFRQYHKITNSWRLLKILIQFCQTTFLTLLIISHIKSLLTNQFPIVKKPLDSIYSSILNHRIATLTFSIGLSLNILGCFIIGIKIINFFRNLKREANQSKVDKILTYCGVSFFILNEIIVYPMFWSLSQIYFEHGFISFLVQGILPILIYIIINLKDEAQSIYGIFGFPVVFIIGITQNELFLLIVKAISIHRFINKSGLFERLCLAFIVVLLSLVLINKNHLYVQNGADIGLSIVFFLTILPVVALLVIKFHINQSLQIISEDQCFQKLKLLKNQIPKLELKFDSFYVLFIKIHGLFNSFENDQIPLIMQDKLQKKRPSQWAKQDFLFVLQNFLEVQKNKKVEENTFNMKILLIKIKMAKGQEMNAILSIFFSLVNEIKEMGQSWPKEMWELKIVIEQKFTLRKNDLPYANEILSINQLNQHLEIEINQILKHLLSFWRLMEKKTLIQSQLDETIQTIITSEKKVHQISEKLQDLSLILGGFSNIHKKMELVGALLNNYKQQQSIHDSLFSINKVLSINFNSNNMILDEAPISSYFLILENNLIKMVSNALLKSLNQKSYSVYNLFPIQTFLGQEFSLIVKNKLNNQKFDSQKEEFILPLICQDSFVQLRKARLLWYPSIECNQRFMLYLSQTQQFPSQPFLLVNAFTEQISYFNQLFIMKFGLRVDELKVHKNQKISMNEIFNGLDIAIDEMKYIFNQQKSVNCRMNLSKFFNEGNMQQIKVQIQLLETITIDKTKQYFVIKVSQNKGRLSFSSHDASQTNSKPPDHSLRQFKSNGMILHKKFEGEKFFCKIPNNYQNKIIQKQAQLSELGRWKHRYLIHILFTLLVVVIVFFCIYDSQLTNRRIDLYNQYSVAMQNKSEVYTLLYQTYSTAAKKYYVKSYPEQITLVRKVTPAAAMAQYTTSQQRFLDDFLNRYLLQVNQRLTQKVSFKIKFDQFQIITDTDRTNLMDWAQNVKQNIIDNSVSFLFRNYDSYRNLTIKFEESFSYNDFVDNIQTETQNFHISLTIISNVLVFGLLFVYFKVECAIKVIYNLVEMVNQEQAHECKNKFHSEIGKILETLSIELSPPQCVEPERRVDDKFEKSISLRPTQTAMPSLKIKNFDNTRLNSHSHRSSLLDSGYQIQNNAVPIQDCQKQRKIVRQSCIPQLFRKSFFFALLIFINWDFTYTLDKLTHQKQEMVQIFDSKKGLYRTLLNVKRGEVDAMMKPIRQHKFNRPYDSVADLSNMYLMFEIEEHLISDRMKKFSSYARQLITGNLCNLKSTFPVKIIPCEYYLGGMLTKGFNEAFDVYKDNAKKVSLMKLKDFGNTTCTKTKCPPFFEHQYTSIMLGDNIRYLQSLFTNEVKGVYDDIKQQTFYSIIFKLMLTLAFLMGYLIESSRLRRQCNVALKYIQLIPKQTMSSIKIVTYMRKNKVLNQFDML